MHQPVKRIEKDFSLHAQEGHRLDVIDEPLYVIMPLSNTQGHRARWRNFRNCMQHVIDGGAHLITAEIAYGQRAHVITRKIHERHTIVQLRSDQEIWHKEAAMQAATRFLPKDWKYVYFLDGDMLHTRHDWVGEILRQLQHHPVVQSFTHVTYLGPNNEPLNTRISFAERWLRGYTFKSGNKTARNPVFYHPLMKPDRKSGIDYECANQDEWGPPGGGWAFRRREFEEVGGLITWCILGSADWYMAAAMAGFCEMAIPNEYGADLRRSLLEWEKKAQRAFRKNIGVVQGTLLHYWHGKMKDRRYGERERIIKDSNFSPYTDLRQESEGLHSINDDGSERIRLLLSGVHSYNTGRNEDSIDL